MPTLLLLVFLIALAVAALYAFANADPGKLLLRARQLGSLLLLALAGVLALVGRWGLALPLAFLAVSLFLRGGSMFPGFPGSARKSPGQTSKVRSRYIEMTLDHDSGAMAGTVRAGALAGRALDELDAEELRALYREIVSDAESVALLETYLDRRFPDWRAARDAGAGEEGAGGRTRTKRARASGPMTVEEARDVLGVASGASAADIRAAHRRLMKAMHPDQGGSTWLAAKLNEARDLLLKTARGRRGG